MHSPIEAVAAELIVQILECVHQNLSNGSSDLVACLRVCRQWNQHGLKILYRHLVLDPYNLEHFLKGSDRHAVTTCTTSLTLRISFPRLPAWDESKGNWYGIAYHLLDGWLRRLTDVLPTMGKLSTMSIVPVSTCKLSRPTLAAILQALPESCVDLELDTGGLDCDDIDAETEESSVTENSVHLCEELRTVLPRLHHVRVNLKFVCGAIVGTYNENGFNPIKVPHLRQLLVNCRRNMSTSRCCPQTAKAESTEHRSWHSVIHGVGQVSDHEGFSSGTEVLVLGQVSHLGTGRSGVSALLRCHANQKITWAFPLVMPARPSFAGPTVYYVRTHEGGVVGEGFPVLQDILEDYAWSTLMDGSRLPKYRIRNIPVEELRVTTEEQWRALWPGKSCMLWINERETGLRLVEAEKRTRESGSTSAYDDLRGLVEMTPDGWYRPEGSSRLHSIIDLI